MGRAEPCNREANTAAEEGERVPHLGPLLLRASFFGHAFGVCLSHIHTHARTHAWHTPPTDHPVAPATPQPAAAQGLHPPDSLLCLRLVP